MTAPSRTVTGNRTYDQRPDRDRAINSLTVACPDCSAGVGERCATGSGHYHPARRRMAIRLLHESGALVAVDLPLPSARKLQLIRRALGLTRSALAEQLGIPTYTVASTENGHRPTGDAAARIATWYAEVTRSRRPA